MYIMISNVLLAFSVVLGIILLTAIVTWFILLEQRRYKDEKLLLSEQVVSTITMKRLVDRSLKSMKKQPKQFTMMLVDIDYFNEIIDAYGEDEEKLILSYFIKNMMSILPKESSVSQGNKIDQFYIYVPASFDQSQILSLAIDVKKAAEKKIQLFDKATIQKKISVAVVSYPMHGTTTDALMQALDITLYVAKKAGGNTIKYYSESLSQNQSQQQLQNDLKAAISREEFVYVYQPIIMSNASRKIYGAEALLRWNHPKLGLLSPADFIHLAEQSGQLDKIGIWGVETAIQMIVKLESQHRINDFVVNINLSPRQLMNDDTYDIFERMIQKYRAKTASIAIEIPDFSLYRKNEQMLRNALRMKTLGFRSAVDISSIDYDMIDAIEKHQIDMVKISRKFFQLEESYAKSKFLKMMIDFAQNKNILLVAEGVETEQQLELLHDQGIIYAQGYHIAKPMNDEQLISFLEEKQQS